MAAQLSGRVSKTKGNFSHAGNRESVEARLIWFIEDGKSLPKPIPQDNENPGESLKQVSKKKVSKFKIPATQKRNSNFRIFR